jgi:hypothetical protein
MMMLKMTERYLNWAFTFNNESLTDPAIMLKYEKI